MPKGTVSSKMLASCKGVEATVCGRGRADKRLGDGSGDERAMGLGHAMGNG